MKFKQLLPITTKLQSPFYLKKVFIAMDKKSTRKSFRCGYRAVAELQKLNLDPKKYYGAEVYDSRGTLIAEVE